MEGKGMKHTRFFFALAALSAVFSCAKEEQTLPVDNGEKGLVPMTVSAGLETKTYVSGTDIIWEDTDDLAIFDGTAKRVFSISNISGTTADFSGEVADGSTEFYAAYPAASASALSAGVLTASLPSAQVIPAGKNVAQGALLAVGKVAADKSLSLKNVFAYLTVEVTRDDVVSIIIGGTDIAGTATFNAEGVLQAVTAGQSSVTVTYEGGVAFPAGKYYIPVLPGTTAAGSFSVAMTALEGANPDWCAERVATKAVTTERNKGLAFGELDTKVEWYFNIKDAASLERFRALVGADTFPADGVAKFTSDINLSGETLAAAAGTFSGTLDGQGHTITNWTSNGVSLLNIVGDGTAKSVVKGITLAATCDLTNEASVSDFGFIANIVAKASEMTDCHNKANVTVNVSDTGAKNIGSLVGASNGKIHDCSNSGSIILNVQGSLGTDDLIEFGGVIGSIVASTDVSSLTNTGNITVNTVSGGSLGRTEIGGVAGYAGGAYTYSSIENSGNITNNGESANTVYIGGLFGRYGSATLTSGVNDGSISNTGDVTSIWMGGLVGTIQGLTINASSDRAVLNTGIVSNTGTVTNQYIGGVIGHENDSASSITGAVNDAKVSTSAPATEIRIGGILGSSHQPLVMASNVNNGPVEIGSAASGNAQVSGILGYSQSSCNITGNTNLGDITIDGGIGTLNLGGAGVGLRSNDASVSISDNVNRGAIVNNGANGPRIGGIIGYTNKTGATISGNKNYGQITHAKASTTSMWVGGIMGVGLFTAMENNINYAEGKIQATKLSTGANKFGGIIGEHQNAAPLTSCKNYADVELSPSNEFSGQLFLSGISGYDNNATSSYSSCENYGKLSVSGTSTNTGYNYVSGIATSSGTNLNFTNCVNNGDLYADCSLKWRMGGIAAYVAGGTFSGNTVACDITMASESKTDHNIGGLVGYSGRSPYVDCSYEGTIDASGGCNTANKGFSGGLLGSSNGSVTFQGCSVKAVMVKGTNSITGAFVGGQFNTDNLTYTFEASGTSNCKVLSGTTVGGVAVSDGSDDSLLVGKRSDKNRTVVQTAIDFE